jgi:predicted nucleic acid-binding protein
MIILDASALTKLVVKEENSMRTIREVNEAIQMGETIASPDIALAESLNSVWKHVTLLKDINKKEADEAAEQLFFIWNKITKLGTEGLAQIGMEIAIGNNLPVYDSLYIAASKSNNAPLFTFDSGMAKKAGKLGIRLL